jgi:hypothetical protein
MMRAPFPDAQARAGHVPAEVYRSLPDGARVVVVVAEPVRHRHTVSPLLLLTIVCGSAGIAASLYLLGQLLLAAAPLAGGGVGITLALRKGSK